MKLPSLSSNQLKLLALITMTIDHLGYYLLPHLRILRYLGRLAFPIFAYMIAEGCTHTKHPARYLGTVLGTGIVCELIRYALTGRLFHCILFTFALSIVLCRGIAWAREGDGWRWLGVGLGLLFALFWAEVQPRVLPMAGFGLEYGLPGVLLPVFIWLGRDRQERWRNAALGLVALCLRNQGFQWFCLPALVPLALYNGQRGTIRLKYAFYLYYPAHLCIFWCIRMLLAR